MATFNLSTGRASKAAYDPIADDAVVNPTSVVEVQAINPKRAGSKAAARFETYKGYKGPITKMLTDTKATIADVRYDLEAGFIKLIKS